MSEKIFKKNIRTVFMGTTELSENILQTLIEEGYDLVGVFTKPDAKIGRKQELTSPAVKILAEKNNIPVFQPQKFKAEGLEELKKLNPDLIVVAAYGKILPEEALKIPKFGCINVHVSLLPKYRGASPVQNALLSGETETGTTIMLMDRGIDTGDMLAQEKLTIDPEDNTDTLMKKLSMQGAQLLAKTIPLWIEEEIKPTVQDHPNATYCQMINREDGHIDWNNSAKAIYDRYRGFSPWPGIFSYMSSNGEKTRLKLTNVAYKDSGAAEHSIGEIIRDEADICVQTSEGLIILKQVQKEGKKVSDIKSFISGHPAFIGSVLI